MAALWVAVVVALCLLCTATVASAQSDEDRAAAQALFDKAKVLRKDGDLEEACKNFQASQKMDPAVGTQLNLADCYEELGRTASAWVNFVEAADHPDIDERRAAYARKRAAELEPRLSRLKLQVDFEVEGLKITRDGERVPNEVWGTSFPVDLGRYRIEATAPGHEPWSKKVRVKEEGGEVEVRVPPLTAIEGGSGNGDGNGNGGGPDKGDEGGSWQTPTGGVLVGLGAVAIGVGAAFAAIAHSKASDSEAFCPNDPNICTQDGVDLRNEARSAQTIYIASFAAGGAVALAGIIMLATAPSSGDSAEEGDEGSDKDALLRALPLPVPVVTPDYGGLHFVGHF